MTHIVTYGNFLVVKLILCAKNQTKISYMEITYAQDQDTLIEQSILHNTYKNILTRKYFIQNFFEQK